MAAFFSADMTGHMYCKPLFVFGSEEKVYQPRITVIELLLGLYIAVYPSWESTSGYVTAPVLYTTGDDVGILFIVKHSPCLKYYNNIIVLVLQV